MLFSLSAAKRRREDGFTLIELLVVVIIIGVLAAIALPIFINQQKVAVEASVKSDVRNTVTNVNGWRSNNLGALPNSAEAYAALGGKLATSKNAYVNVAFAADGTYTVCGYNPGAAHSTDHAHAWLFDSATGKFAAGVADCVNAVHQRADADDTSGDAATSDGVVTFPLGSSAGNGSGSGGSGGTGGSGAGTGSGSSAGSTTVIAYDPDGTQTITPGSGGNSGIPGTVGGPAGTGHKPQPVGGSGGSNPTTGDPGTGDPGNPSGNPGNPSGNPGTTPVLASPGGTTLAAYAVGAGNPSCSYAAAPAVTSTFIDANCHKVHAASVRSITFNGIPDWGFVYNFDHDDACLADGVAAGKPESANLDSQGRPCDWLMLGGNGANTSSSASYGQYYFDYGSQPASWYGTGPNPADFPCAAPVYPTNYQKYAFAVCQKDHGWAYNQADLDSGGK